MSSTGEIDGDLNVHDRVDELLGVFVELAITPAVLELSQEAGQPIELEVTVVRSRARKNLHIELDKGCGGATAKGEVRVFLKDRSYPCRFAAEAMIDGLAPGTGFSGFSMRGRISIDNEKPVLKIAARTNRYNVREWGRDFRCS